jgi:hypothetical protein
LPYILSDCSLFFCLTTPTTIYSTFKDIFDEPHFIKALEGDVHIVSDLPGSLQSAPRARKHFTSWSGASYYEEVKELWKNQKVVQLHFKHQTKEVLFFAAYYLMLN